MGELLTFLGGATFISCLALTLLVRNTAARFHCFDQPDVERKFHHVPVPRVGGVAIFISYFLSLVLLAQTALPKTPFAAEGAALLMMLFPPALILFLTGLWDDIWGMWAKKKLAWQIVMALVACATGLRFQSIGGFELSVWMSVPLTVVWLLLCVNAVNLIDGVDGLAAGLSCIAAATAIVVASQFTATSLMILAAPLVGALLAFLCFNSHPASIFLGDSGSMFLGLVLGAAGILWPANSAAPLAFLAPVFLLALPFADTGLSILRRYIANKPIFGADHGHMHHRLAERGLGVRGLVVVMYAGAFVAAVVSVLQSTFALFPAALATSLFLAVAIRVVAYLRYPEFEALASLNLRSRVRARLAMRTYEERLKRASTPEECWQAVQAVAQDFGLIHATLEIKGVRFATPRSLDKRPTWEYVLPLSHSDRLALSFPGSGQSGDLIAHVTDLFARQLPPKVPELRRGVSPRLPRKRGVKVGYEEGATVNQVVS